MKTKVIIVAAMLFSACGLQSGRNACPSGEVCGRGTGTACAAACTTADAATDTTRMRTTESNAAADRVEVLYFHTRRRCATCQAIESRTRELVEQEYSREAAEGRLVLRIIDISQDPDTAERYGVAWSSLLISRNGGESREHVEDLTTFAFANARNAPGKFREGLKRKIDDMIGK